MKKDQKVTQKLSKKSIEIKWSDQEIDKLKYSGKENRVTVQFKGSKSFIPGVSMRWTQTTNRKVFELVFKYNGKTDKLVLGIYSKDFKTAQCYNKFSEICEKAKDPKDPIGWFKNPKDVFKTLNSKAKKDNDILLKEAIELIVKDNFPRKKIVGNICADTQQSFCRHLIGYNERLKELCHTDNEKGWGVTTLRSKSKIKTFDELFKIFEPGVGRKDTKEISFYDHELGQCPIREITSYKLEEYLDEIPRSYGQKLNILRAYSTLFNYARKKHLLGNPIPSNPTKDITLILNEDPSSPASEWNDDLFDLHELRLIDEGLIKLGRKRPMQVEAIMFLACTGIRIAECCKLQWSHIIKDDEGKQLIKVPRYIIKGRSRAGQKDENIYIEPGDDGFNPILRVFDRVNRNRRRKGFHKHKHIPYIFSSPRADTMKLMNTTEYPGYAYSENCRISPRTLNDTWRDLKNITGLTHGSIKTLRKTYITHANEILGGEHQARHLTRHKTAWINAKHYDKRKSVQVRAMARKVGNVLNFKKS